MILLKPRSPARDDVIWTVMGAVSSPAAAA